MSCASVHADHTAEAFPRQLFSAAREPPPSWPVMPVIKARLVRGASIASIASVARDEREKREGFIALCMSE